MLADNTLEKPDKKSSLDDVLWFRRALLGWYDRHRRVLPWRAVEGVTPDPYLVWMSEIMLQQTTVQAVIPYFLKFTERWPCVHDLAAADVEDVMHEWAGLGYYARARNMHKCANVVVSQYDGVFPSDQKSLKALPGIGDYTSAAIMAIAFDKPAVVVDGNIERVMSRYHARRGALKDIKKHLKELAADYFLSSEGRPGDLAQGLMDLGATICTPKSPKCALCPLQSCCEAFRLDIAEELPEKSKKKARPRKRGYVYWVENTLGEVLVERRPTKGLLGGMIGLPTSDWLVDQQKLTHIDMGLGQGHLEPLGLSVHHIFTHFELSLDLYRIKINEDMDAYLHQRYSWQAVKTINDGGFPTVFRKAVALFMT